MPRNISGHLKILRELIGCGEQTFRDSIRRAMSADSKQFDRWMQSDTRVRDKSLRDLCTDLKSNEDRLAQSEEDWKFRLLAQLELDDFTDDLEVFQNRMKERLNSCRKPKADIDISRCYFVIRKLRYAAYNSHALAVEFMYMESAPAERRDRACSLVTRSGQVYSGTGWVVPNNFLCNLEYRNNNGTEFSARSLNCALPARGLNPVICGLMQRTTKSDSYPASYFMAMAQVDQFVSDTALLDHVRSTVHILAAQNDERPATLPKDLALVGTLFAKDFAEAYEDIVLRLAKCVDVPLVRDEAEDPSVDGPALSVNLRSAGEIARIWEGASFKPLVDALVSSSGRK